MPYTSYDHGGQRSWRKKVPLPFTLTAIEILGSTGSVGEGRFVSYFQKTVTSTLKNNYNLGIAKMLVIPENPVIPKTSVVIQYTGPEPYLASRSLFWSFSLQEQRTVSWRIDLSLQVEIFIPLQGVSLNENWSSSNFSNQTFLHLYKSVGDCFHIVPHLSMVFI